VRLKACLLRPAIRSTERATWSPAPLRWRSAVVWPTPAQQRVVPADVRAMPAHPERLQRLEQALHARVPPWRRAPVGAALQALRGVQGTLAVTPGPELGELTRVEHPRQRLRYLGCTPSAYAPGERRRQGGMPKAGHAQARRVLLAGAGASRDPATGRRHLHLPLEKGPTPIQAIRWHAHGRLGPRSRQRIARRKKAPQVVGALARARRALMGAMAQEVPLTPESATVKRPQSLAPRCAWASDETQPRWRAPLAGVQRLNPTLGPRARQAPDGRQAGGRPPTESSRSNRRLFLAPALPMDNRPQRTASRKKMASACLPNP
jgi:hypothetical protein